MKAAGEEVSTPGASVLQESLKGVVVSLVKFFRSPNDNFTSALSVSLLPLLSYFLGFGYTTCLLIGGNLKQAPGVGTKDDYNYGIFKLVYGAVGFPFGFTTIVVCGAELYTSLCAYMTAAWWEGKVRTVRLYGLELVGRV